MRRIGRDNLADDEPVEQHADGGEVLFDRRLLEILPKTLDIGRDVQRLDVGDLADLVMLAPAEEPNAGPIIGHAGVFVADGGGEEFEEAAAGLVAGRGGSTGQFAVGHSQRKFPLCSGIFGMRAKACRISRWPGKGDKTRYLPLHRGTNRLFNDYLEALVMGPMKRRAVPSDPQQPHGQA